MGTLAAGIKEIFATAKTTGSNVMLCGNDGTPDGHMTMANLASVLGGLETQIWNGGSFENLLRHNRQGVYYVDQDYNGIQSDMPFPYCVISINYISYGSNNDVQAQAIAFNITNGDVKYKCVSGIGSDRDYPWRDVPIGLPTFYKNYANLSSLANALGDIFHIKNYKIELPNGGNGQISLPSTACFIVAVPRGASYQMTVMCVEGSSIAFIKDGYVKERWSVTREGVALPILHFAAGADYFNWMLIVLAMPE